MTCILDNLTKTRVDVKGKWGKVMLPAPAYRQAIKAGQARRGIQSTCPGTSRPPGVRAGASTGLPVAARFFPLKGAP